MLFRLILGFLVLALTSGCTDRATESECDEAFDKLNEIRSKDQPKMVKVVTLDRFEQDRPGFLESCVGVASRENIRCWLEARTEDDLKKCP